MREFTVQTERQSQLVDITEQVQAALGELDGAAAALVYVPHTTAGVTINEHADPAVARDFEAALERIVSEDWPWQHVEEGEENAPTHIRAAFMGPTCSSRCATAGSRSAPGRGSSSASSTARASARST